MYFHIVKQRGAVNMEKETGVLVIAGACMLVLFMVTVKHKAELLLNF